MTPSLMTLSIMALGTTTISTTKVKIMTLSRTLPRRKTVSITTLSRMALNIKTDRLMRLTRTTFASIVHKLTQSRTEAVQTALTKTIHCTEYHFAE